MWKESKSLPAPASSPAPAAAPSPPWWTSTSSVRAPAIGCFQLWRIKSEQMCKGLRPVKGNIQKEKRSIHLLRPLPPPPPPRPPLPPLLISTLTRFPQSRVPSSSLHASVASLLSWKVHCQTMLTLVRENFETGLKVYCHLLPSQWKQSQVAYAPPKRREHGQFLRRHPQDQTWQKVLMSLLGNASIWSVADL